MANVRVAVVAPVRTTPSRQAVLICGSLRVVLPWWPEDISWSSAAPTWSEQQRPGRAPLLLKEAEQLPEIAIGFILANRATTYANDGGSVLPMMETLGQMAKSDTPVQLMLAARESGRYRITDLSVTELEHDTAGQPTKAEVSMTIKRAQDAAAPIGPVSSKKKKKGRG